MKSINIAIAIAVMFIAFSRTLNAFPHGEFCNFVKDLADGLNNEVPVWVDNQARLDGVAVFCSLKSMMPLRRSMMAMMVTEGKDHFAHPMFWAPFVVVGEGGRPM